MALTIGTDSTGNFSGVMGVYQGQTDPLFLGLKNLSTLITGDNGAAFSIGFDTRTSPAQVRLYFDIGNARWGSELNNNYGLVMTSETVFDTLPILPSVFSPDIAYKDSYSNFQEPTSWRRGFSTSAVDMVSPDLLRQKQINDPYFPYNSGDSSAAFTSGGSCGFIANVPPASQDGTPLCASIISPIGIDIDGPASDEMNNLINAIKNSSISFAICEVSNDDLQSGRALAKAAAVLEIDLNKIIMVQMFGNSLLITVDDAEGYYPVFYVDVDADSSTTTKRIYSIDINSLQSLRFYRVSDIFERFIDFANKVGYSNTDYPSRPGYFLRSYDTNDKNRVKTILSGSAHFVGTKYKIYCVQKGSNRQQNGSLQNYFTCFGGVEWKVRRGFNKDTLSFGPIEISQPAPLNDGDLTNYNKWLNDESSMPELSNYFSALRSQVTGPPNQLQWFTPYYPLEARMTSFYENNTEFSNF
ncbi:hypothetical protein ACFFGT_13055 [Mucilaginibacter angelicae]|uniref:Uncharacterized protein n=1 Tax=Mucilaginibacter angelicae TaxID=869718 RepID=A0ABV6L6P5_9SPHI